MGLFDILAGPVNALLGSVGSIIDDLHTSGEEKLQAKLALAQLETGFQLAVIDAEKTIIEEQASIVRAEAQSESALTRMWRPITMLAFVGLLFLRWFGLTPDNLSQSEVLAVFDIVKIGIGGYVVSRGVEKSVSTWRNGNNG